MVTERKFSDLEPGNIFRQVESDIEADHFVKINGRSDLFSHVAEYDRRAMAIRLRDGEPVAIPPVSTVFRVEPCTDRVPKK